MAAVPAATGINTSPAASLALRAMGTLPLLYIRWVFSMTTIASSTIIPSPNNKAKSTMKFKVTLVPMIAFAIGKNMNATKTLSGTLNATKNAFVTPIKNIRMNNTRTKPMIMVLTSSPNEVFVCLLWSPVMTTFRSGGSSSLCRISSTAAFTLSAALIRFSPARLTIFNVTTFFPSSRA